MSPLIAIIARPKLSGPPSYDKRIRGKQNSRQIAEYYMICITIDMFLKCSFHHSLLLEEDVVDAVVMSEEDYE